MLSSIGVRSGGQAATVEAAASLRDGALLIHCHLRAGPIVEAIERTGVYSWTLYGEDDIAVVNVEGMLLEASDPWPDDADIALNLRADLTDPTITGPTTVRKIGGIIVDLGGQL